MTTARNPLTLFDVEVGDEVAVKFVNDKLRWTTVVRTTTQKVFINSYGSREVGFRRDTGLETDTKFTRGHVYTRAQHEALQERQRQMDVLRSKGWVCTMGNPSNEEIAAVYDVVMRARGAS